MCVTTTVTATSKHSPQPSCCPALRAGGQAQPALIPCCPHALCLRAGLPTRLPFLGCCPCFSLHTIVLPHPWGPLCWDRLLATLLRARGNCSVFRPQSHHWEQRPRDTESSRHGQSSSGSGTQLRHFKCIHHLVFVFRADTGLYSSSEFFADPALIRGSWQLVVSTTLSSFKKEKAP